MSDDKYDFAGKAVLVMGLGRFGGGVDAAQFACKAGAKVIVTDLAPAEKLSDSINNLEKFPDIEFHLSSHDKTDFQKADVVIANPAVPDNNEFLGIARRHNRFITSQINIFFELCPARIIGITGSNGKSTTTALTVHLLKNASDRKVWLSGNIGNQPLLTILDKIKADDLVVLELSSFQLEQLAQVKKMPDIALLTNLTPNHLDRYGTFKSYCAAKENIFRFQQLDDKSPAVSFFNTDDKVATEWFEKFSKDKGRICIGFSSSDIGRGIRDSFPLLGLANLSNLAAAVAIAKHFGIDEQQIKKALPDFKALPHRLELVENINDVYWYNDSKATTPLSAIAALEAFDRPVIIIAGGYDKNIPFDELGQKIAQKAKAAVLIGQTAPKIADAIDKSLRAQRSNLKKPDIQVELVKSLSEAVQSANRVAQTGDIILLSPACASYDMFENFQQRGLEFCQLAKRIKEQAKISVK